MFLANGPDKMPGSQGLQLHDDLLIEETVEALAPVTQFFQTPNTWKPAWTCMVPQDVSSPPRSGVTPTASTS